MLQVVCVVLAVCSPAPITDELPQESTRLESWLNTRLSWPLQVDVFQGGAAIDDDSARSTSDERGEQTVASQVVHDPALADADEEAEPLESIEESRPDDLDEFVETNSGREKSIDIEELSESPDGSVLGDDGEIDWTTQAD